MKHTVTIGKKLLSILLVLVLALSLLPMGVLAAEAEPVSGSVEIFASYNREKSTAAVEKSDNAADMENARVTAKAGDVLVFDNIDFTGAKTLMVYVQETTAVHLDFYVDSVEASNKIGAVDTSVGSNINDRCFMPYYTDLATEPDGGHDLILSFPTDTTVELDFFKLTSYTGAETTEERDARMKWWRDAKYGQFIHFGAYAQLGGVYNGQNHGGYSEWIMNNQHIGKEEYKEIAAVPFNPDQWDPEKIVADAKAAGQEYIVLTSRHHEGLSIFDTKVRNYQDYSIFSVSNYGEYEGMDLVKTLSDECKKQGIHFGVYTTIMDWHDPSQENWGGIISNEAKNEYATQLQAQIKELIEEYGVEVFFFDGEWVGWWTKQDGQEMYRYILSLNEDCIVNNRVGKRHVDDGDYGTPEQEIPATGLDYDWESCVTMNNSWGYCIGDTSWKSPQWIVNSVMDIASKGGNLLLNVGPDPHGVVEEAPIERMAAAGRWFEQFGEAVYGTRANIFSQPLDRSVRITTAAGKVYVTLLEKDPKQVGQIKLPLLENEILGARDLATGQEVPCEVVGDAILLNVAATEKQEYATVYVIDVDGQPAEKAGIKEENLALGKSVTVSSEYDNAHGGHLLTNGERSERWAPLDQEAAHWATIDLGEVKALGRVVFYEWWDNFYTKDFRCASYKIAVSDDGEIWTDVYTGTDMGDGGTAELPAGTSGRYVKIYDIQRKSSAKGGISLHEVEIYAPKPVDPVITVTEAPDRAFTLPITLKGTYEAGTAVEINVWGANFTPFNLEAQVDAENGAWSVTIDDERITAGSLVFTAYLTDGEGHKLAADTAGVEYIGKRNLALNQPAILSSEYTEDPGHYYGSRNLTDGDLTNRWAPKDKDADVWAMVDLGDVKNVEEIVIYEWLDTFFGNVYRAKSFKVSVSADGEVWTEIHDGGSMGDAYTITPDEPVAARYVKVHDIVCLKEDVNVSLHEIEVFGSDVVEVPGEHVTMAVTGADRVTVDQEEISFTVSVRDAAKLANVTVELAVDEETMVDPIAAPAEGWMIVAQTWKDGKLKVALGNVDGLTGEGDVCTVTAKATGKRGSATVSIESAVLSVYETEEGEHFVEAILGDEAKAVTVVTYSVYDVNHDGVVNQLDITRAQRFYGTTDEICDVNGDGEVNVADMILILNNFTEEF